MIFPTKHVPPEETLLGVGAVLLRHLSKPISVIQLWEQCKGNKLIDNYERFILGLDVLYILGAIDYDVNKIRITNNDS